MKEEFGTSSYDYKYTNKNETLPRSVVRYFVDKYLVPSTKCLDLGAGAGRHSKYIAEKGVSVTAVDLSEVGISKTAEILKDFPGSVAVVADIHKLPFDDDSFDSLVCNRVLDYNDDAGLEVAFSEICRVVKSEGILLLTVRSVSQPPKQDEVIQTENEHGGKSFRVADSTQIQHYFSEAEISVLATKNNFEIIEKKEDHKTNGAGDSKSEWQVILKKVS